MTNRLDLLVERLGAGPTDHSLDHFEAGVIRGMRRSRIDARTTATLAPISAVSIGLALALGVTAGGVTALSAVAAPSRSNNLTEELRLAPSSLLESGR